jgi:hypothetical protein
LLGEHLFDERMFGVFFLPNKCLLSPAAPAAQNMVFPAYWIYFVFRRFLGPWPGRAKPRGSEGTREAEARLCGAYDDLSRNLRTARPFVDSPTVVSVTLDTAHFLTIVPPSVTVDVGGSLFG